ncbi:MAG: hypothetical protein WDW38_002532 [Sanguina aurantia]
MRCTSAVGSASTACIPRVVNHARGRAAEVANHGDGRRALMSGPTSFVCALAPVDTRAVVSRLRRSMPSWRRIGVLVHSGEERVAYDVILAASCQPRSEQQRALSATAAGPARMLPSIVTGALPCLKLHEHIRAARLAGAPFVVQSKTGDLPKVMLVLYLELLASSRPVNLTVVHSRGRKGPLGGPGRDQLERIRILAQQAVNPGMCLSMSVEHLDLYLDLDDHNLLIN